jgi:hypothetical protein
MLQRVKVTTLPLAARYGEHAPMAAVCCNACRTCAQTNALVAVAAAAAWLASFAGRLLKQG